VEAGFDTVTVALPVVENKKKKSLESETVKYDLESHETRERK
jgi:hypothetical protein